MSKHDGTIEWMQPPAEMVERIRRWVRNNKFVSTFKRATADLADEWRALGDAPAGIGCGTADLERERVS